jgi:hypothetical protein
VDAVLEDLETAPISPSERALFEFVQRVNGASYALRQSDARAAMSAGWSEEALYSAVTVCALFNFYNRWCDGTGVHALSVEAHAMGGRRLAEYGYAPPPAR